MITDAAVFTEDYRPQNLLHRDAEQDQLARAFKPALAGDRASDALVHGPQGVGKTLLTNHLLDRLDARADIQYATVRSLARRHTEWPTISGRCERSLDITPVCHHRRALSEKRQPARQAV